MMNSLKLLSRSSGIRNNTEPQRKIQKIPLESLPANLSPTEIGSSRKRKRNDEVSNPSETGQSSAKITPGDDVRKVQNDHKIRIVNVRQLRGQDAPGSRKSHKEQSRVFPQPLTDFCQLSTRYDVRKALARNVAAQGYREPTEVQIATIPLLLDHDSVEPDLMIVAPTGSGKTLAFLIPLVQKLATAHHTEGDDEPSRHVRAVILAPTRELATQIVNEGKKLAQGTGVKITLMRKGMKLATGDEEDASSSSSSDAESNVDSESESKLIPVVKSDIIVSTPLSLVHALSDDGDKDLSPLPQIQSLILDEADVLLDPLFKTQTLSIWSACTSPTLRVSLWSATIGASIEELAISTIDSRYDDLGVTSKPPLLRTIIGLKDTSIPNISHRLVYTASEQGKLLGMRQLLHPSRTAPIPSSSISNSTKAAMSPEQPLRPPFLVFTQTIDRATSLHRELLYDIPPSAGGPSRIAVLHSSLSSTQRSDIMTRFRKGQIWILITTDLLSRGVDFRGVNGVVNYDIPNTSASYVHRAGRTGRAGREGGVCVTFYTKEDVKYVKAIANVIAASQKKNSTGHAENDSIITARNTNTASNTSTSTSSSTATAQNITKLEGLAPWILNALPSTSKKDKKDLKQRGVQSRRGIKESDDAEQRRIKRKSLIGTQSGYERREKNRKVGAIEGSRRRKNLEMGGDGDDGDGDGRHDDWNGIED